MKIYVRRSNKNGRICLNIFVSSENVDKDDLDDFTEDVSSVIYDLWDKSDGKLSAEVTVSVGKIDYLGDFDLSGYDFKPKFEEYMRKKLGMLE